MIMRIREVHRPTGRGVSVMPPRKQAGRTRKQERGRGESGEHCIIVFGFIYILFIVIRECVVRVYTYDMGAMHAINLFYPFSVEFCDTTFYRRVRLTAEELVMRLVRIHHIHLLPRLPLHYLYRPLGPLAQLFP